MKVPLSQDFSRLVEFSPVSSPEQTVHGTTVLATRFDKGVAVIADRRATMGNLIMYEHAEKILPLDKTTLVAVSGAYAKSIETGRYLRHAFKYYERLNLVEISTEGKLTEISRALQANMAVSADGNGVFLPIAASYDPRSKAFGVYFFDLAGARFQSSGYACAGSGSERIRGVFEYLIRIKGPFESRPLDDVLSDDLVMLDIASELDSATGGWRKTLPSVFVLTESGYTEYEQKELSRLVAKL